MNPLKFNARNEAALDLYCNQSPQPVREAVQFYQAKLTRTEIFENQIEDDDDFVNTLEELTSYKPNLDVSQISKSIENMMNCISDYNPISLASDSDSGTPFKPVSKIFNKMITSSPVKKPETPSPGEKVRQMIKELQQKEPFAKAPVHLTSTRKLPRDHPEKERFIPSVKNLAKELEAQEPFSPSPMKKKTADAVKRTSNSVKRMAEMFNVKLNGVLKNPTAGGYKILDNSLTPPARPPPPVVSTEIPVVKVVKRIAPKPPVPRPRSFCSSECESDAPKPKPTPRKRKPVVISPKIRENMKVFEKLPENPTAPPLNPPKNTINDDPSYETLSVKEKIDLFNKFLSQLDKNSTALKKLPRQQQLISQEKKMVTPKKPKFKVIGKINSPFTKSRRAKHSLFVPTSKRKTIDSKNERLSSLIDDAPPHKKRHIRVEIPSRKFLKSQYLENLFHQWLQDNQGVVSKSRQVSFP